MRPNKTQQHNNLKTKPVETVVSSPVRIQPVYIPTVSDL